MAGESWGDLVPFARVKLIERIREATDRIWLTSPFLSYPVAKEIAEAAAESTATDRKLLTAASERSVAFGVLDARGLERLQQAEFEIVDIENLHAKVCLVDSDWGLVGSGNLTGKGLGEEEGGGNRELGVILTADQRAAASAIVSGWRETGVRVDAAEVERLKRVTKVPREPQRRRRRRPELPIADVARLKQFLAKEVPTEHPPRYWIDANYHDRDNETWWHRKWINGQPEVEYAEDDLIIIYLGSKHRGPKACPAIVQATTSTEPKPGFVEEHDDDPEAPERWPNVTCIEILGEVDIPNGIPLELLEIKGEPLTGMWLQRGFHEITREEFEVIATAMVAKED